MVAGAFIFLCLFPITISTSKDKTENVQMQELCQVNGAVASCFVPSSKLLDFKNIREWSKRQNRQDISFNIVCEEGGKVNIPWPMKAKNLVRIEVQDCILGDYYRDSFNKTLDDEPDYLQDVALINCGIEINIRDSINRELNMHRFSKSFHCGSLASRRIIKRNVTYRFTNEDKTTSKQLMESGIFAEVFDKVKNMDNIIPYTCNYDHLVIIDDGICKTRGKLYFEALTSSSLYPRLEFYNLSYNELSVFPVQLGNWSTFFPSLEILDLSHNYFQTFNFSSYSADSLRIKPLYVDFQYNKFEQFPPGSLRILSEQPAVIVDLRHNPIMCGCRLQELKDYLHSVQTLYPEYTYLLDLKCHLPPYLKDRDVLSVDTSHCHS